MVKVLAVNSIPLDHPWLFSGILNVSEVENGLLYNG
jgi:hypothetical protein